MTWDSDYAYIQIFIDFLNQIVEMIKGFFGGASKEEDDAANA